MNRPKRPNPTSQRKLVKEKIDLGKRVHNQLIFNYLRKEADKAGIPQNAVLGLDQEAEID